MSEQGAAERMRCARLVRVGRYARTFCDRPAGDDGVCRRHRYVEKRARAEREARHRARRSA